MPTERPNTLAGSCVESQASSNDYYRYLLDSHSGIVCSVLDLVGFLRRRFGLVEPPRLDLGFKQLVQLSSTPPK
jgi:hypothetical protein